MRFVFPGTNLTFSLALMAPPVGGAPYLAIQADDGAGNVSEVVEINPTSGGFACGLPTIAPALQSHFAIVSPGKIKVE